MRARPPRRPRPARAALLAATVLLPALLGPTPAGAQGERTRGPFPVEAAPATVHRGVFAISMANGVDFGSADLAPPVPPGQRFVVELLTALVDVPAGQAMRLGLLAGTLVLPIPLVSQGTFGGEDRLHAYLPGRFYLDAGAAATAAANRTGTTGAVDLSVSLSGYLVDLPPPAGAPAGSGVP
jgi:hypothetical protein